MFKNTGSQKVIVFAFDATTNVPKTGDAANITAYLSKDFGAVTQLTDTSATEMDATNAAGYYLFDITQTETNADCILISGKSSTANIKIIGAPATVFTLPAGMGTDGVFPSVAAGSAGGLFIAGTNAATTVTGSLTTTFTGNLTGSVGAVTGLTASNLDATISSRLASASYTAPDNTSITAIKTQTDKLTFTVANQIDSNIQYVNDVQINGNGSVGAPWGP